MRDRKGLSQTVLAEKIGVKPNTISNYESGNSAPDFDKLNMIIKELDTDANTILFVDLRLYPEGYPQTSVVNEPGIGHKKHFETYGDKLIMWVPVINQPAYAGYLNGYNDVTYIGSLPKEPWMVDKEYKGNYLTFEANGDSMDDGSSESIKEKDKVLGREVSRYLWANDKLHIKKYDFVIAHKHGLTIKRIIDHNTQKRTLTLHPLNSFYQDYEVSIDDIYTIFNIVAWKRAK